MSTRGATPEPRWAALALLTGVLLGGALIWPAVPEAVTALPALSSMGDVGLVLIGGTVGLLALSVGLFVLYVGLLLVESRL